MDQPSPKGSRQIVSIDENSPLKPNHVMPFDLQMKKKYLAFRDEPSGSLDFYREESDKRTDFESLKKVKPCNFLTVAPLHSSDDFSIENNA